MAFFSRKTITFSKLTAGIALFTSALLIITLNGCFRTDEKNYSGAAKGEFPLHYELAMKYAGQGQVHYELKVVPTNVDLFLSHLNKKWHDEAQLKFSAYDKLKEYCDLYKDTALCFNYSELKQAVESKEIAVFYTVKAFDAEHKEIDNISGKFTCNLGDQQTFKDRWLQAANSIAMDRDKFRRIATVELQTK